MNAKLAVAAIAALAVAAQAALLHSVSAPLASAVHDFAEPQRPTFEEHILVEAVARARPPVVPVRG